MLENATQDNRQLSVETPFGKDVLLLSKFHGREEMSRLFEYELEMLSGDSSLDPAAIVGQNVTWLLEQGEHKPRFFNGYVRRFQYVDQNTKGVTYRATIVPWLWFLRNTRDCRIFQHKDVQEIVTQVFNDLGFDDFRWKLASEYVARAYCVQYRESDMDFVARLLEEEGIFFYFVHENGKHTVVLADAASDYIKLPTFKVEYQDSDGVVSRGDRITKWNHVYEFRPGKWTQTDYNFKTPNSNLMTEHPSVVEFARPECEIYDYPGRFEDTSCGRRLTQIRMEEYELPHDSATGECTYRGFGPGGYFRFANHRCESEIGREFVVTVVEISASLAGSYDSSLGDQELMFGCRFECIPASTTYRPPCATRRPIVEGPQTAVIVGPPGEEIYPDEYGRVKVQFHWDREGGFNENSSCWLRVSQVHAGEGWGMIDLPRIGEEVIVGFLEGDPDSPIIIGRVYNGANMPPYSLPEGKTRRGNTTKTHKGAGYNEMTMDDTAGNEQIRINAMYDMNSNVNNDQTLDVGMNQTQNVGVDRKRMVGNNEDVTVNVDQYVSVGSNKQLNVGANFNESVAANKSLNVGVTSQEYVGIASNEVVGEDKSVSVGVKNVVSVGAVMNMSVGCMHHEQAGMERKIVAGSRFEVVCGGSRLVMESSGRITLEASTEMLFVGGGATIQLKGGIVDLN